MLDAQEISQVIDSLIGSYKPIGSTNHDKASLERQKVMEEMIDSYLEKINELVPCKDHVAYSVHVAGCEAESFLRSLRERIDKWLE